MPSYQTRSGSILLLGTASTFLLGILSTVTAEETPERVKPQSLQRFHYGEADGESGFFRMFNGKNLQGWDGQPGSWSVHHGAIHSTGNGKERNWLIWGGGKPTDFELRLQFRFEKGNSGVQVRSSDQGDWQVQGYQVEVADVDEMGLWHHSLMSKEDKLQNERRFLATAGQRVVIEADGTKTVEQIATPEAVQQACKASDWNDLTVIARGPRLIQKVNGFVLSDLTDHQSGFASRSGVIAFQDHGKGTLSSYRNIRIKYLNDNFSAAPTGLTLRDGADTELEPNQSPERPNIIIIMADDLGWADVGYHNSDPQRALTPHLDKFISEGIELDRFTVCPMCTPTRAATLTGRYPIRFGLSRAVVKPQTDYGLAPEEITLPEALVDAGYRQRAIFGKWHLGHHRAKWHPLRHGFTHFRGFYNDAADYFTHERAGERDWHLDWDSSAQEGYITDLIADATVDWIHESALQDAPYFCYAAFSAPHKPLQAKMEDLDRFAHFGGDPTKVNRVATHPKHLDVPTMQRATAAMMWSFDEAIGRILEAVEKSGEADNTIIWFFSDNGGIAEIPDNNLPLRGNKLEVFEGGVRVPAGVRWPARWPGGRVLSEPMSCMDLYPTLLKAAGIKETVSDKKVIDGIDVDRLLSGETAQLPPRDLYFYYGADGVDDEQLAVTTNDWKLVIRGPELTENQNITAEHKVMLFRFPEDLQEEQNLAEDNPTVVSELTDKLIQFRQLQPSGAVAPYNTLEPESNYTPPRNWQIPKDNDR